MVRSHLLITIIKCLKGHEDEDDYDLLTETEICSFFLSEIPLSQIDKYEMSVKLFWFNRDIYIIIRDAFRKINGIKWEFFPY